MRLIYLLLVASLLLGAQDEDKLFECTKIFKDRKSELLVELERIDEEKQALEALKTATEELLKKKKTALDIKEEEINNKLKIVSEKEDSFIENCSKITMSKKGNIKKPKPPKKEVSQRFVKSTAMPFVF